MAFAGNIVAVQVVAPLNLLSSDCAKVDVTERGNKGVIEVDMVLVYADFSKLMIGLCTTVYVRSRMSELCEDHLAHDTGWKGFLGDLDVKHAIRLGRRH